MFLTSYSGGFGLVEEKEDLVKRLRHVMDVEKGQLETELASKIEELESMKVQCPLDIKTLDKAAALPIAAATRVASVTT